jgi:hypothetical protein
VEINGAESADTTKKAINILNILVFPCSENEFFSMKLYYEIKEILRKFILLKKLFFN